MNTLIRTLVRQPFLRPALILVALAFFAHIPAAQAVSPPPDGAYGGGNTAEGDTALSSLTTGTYNTGIGWFSLRSVTSNGRNTAVGAGTLLLNTANDNTATGAGALLNNSTGQSNTASGSLALFSSTIGNSNTANGEFALFANTTGNANTAIGAGALSGNISGGSNTALGFDALAGATTGNGNTALGAGSGSAIGTANGVIAIHSPGGNVDNTAWIANIFGVTPVSGTTAPVVVSDTGQLGTLPSSRQFKRDIQPMDKSSESILALKPVTFHYKSDKTSTPQFGLIAEEVAKVSSDLVVHDDKGGIYAVRYDAVNAMLLNEFLKEHQKVKQLESALGVVNRRLEEQATQIQRVSAQQIRAEKRYRRPTINICKTDDP
jgi:Chaperone of endosialidase